MLEAQAVPLCCYNTSQHTNFVQNAMQAGHTVLAKEMSFQHPCLLTCTAVVLFSASAIMQLKTDAA